MANAQAKPPTYLGVGLLQPFQRDKKGDFANDGGLNLVRACVAQVLSVQADSGDGIVQGEMPWRPEFGSKLYLLKHKRGRVLHAFADVYVKEALARWEPRVVVTSVSASFDNTARTLTITLIYNVITSNIPGNQVLFADVEQQVTVPLAA